MPPPVVRSTPFGIPTPIQATRALIVDEKERREKVAAEKDCRSTVLKATRASIVDENRWQIRTAGVRAPPAVTQIQSRKDDVDNRNESRERRIHFRNNWTGISEVCKGNEYTPALEASKYEENVQVGSEQPYQECLTIEDLAKSGKKRLEQEADQTMERLMRKHKQEVETIKNNLQRQHRKEIDKITNALNNKHDKEIAKMRKELQDMKLKKELAENELEKAKKALNDADKEVHHVMNATVNQKCTVKFTGKDKPLQRAPVMLPSDNLLFYQNRLLSRSAPENAKAPVVRTVDRSTKSAEYVNAISDPVSKQQHEIPNEKPVMDKTVKTIAGMKSTVTGETASGDKIQNPTGGVPDPYGYTRISASQARLYRDNLDFYQNRIYSKPSPGHTVEEMLKWKGNYSMLERNHRYIQWLFPIPEENGLNMYAQQLFEHEAQAITDDATTLKRVLMAYKMMLDFYGMQLVSSKQGIVKRSSKGWEERYDHLNRSRHNLLWITRILKSLGVLGYERLQAPWVDFLIEEAVVKKELPNLNGPCLMHWVMAVKDDGEREVLFRKANGLPINQDTADMDNIGSESEDEDKEGDKMQTKGLDQNDAEMSRLTLKDSENRQKHKDPELLKHDDKATAMLKQTKVAESVNSASVSNKKGEKPDKKDNAEATIAKAAIDKSTKGAEFVKSTSESVSKQKPENPIEKSVNDKTDETSTEGMKSTTAGIQTSGKKPTADSRLPSDNLKFYQNKLISRPTPGFTIETMLRYKGQYTFFDEYWCFIHWLFPIPETTGKNTEAQVLLEHEAKEIRADDELSSRVLKAFKLMLDFYGMCLSDDVVGKFKRNKKTYKERYDYLQRYRNNYMRITRILRSLGELGYERFQVPWIEFLIIEGIDNAKFPTLDGQCINHWICAIKEDGERHAMFQKYRELSRYRALIVVDNEDMEVDDADVKQNTGPIFPHYSPADFASAERSGFFHPLADV